MKRPIPDFFATVLWAVFLVAVLIRWFPTSSIAPGLAEFRHLPLGDRNWSAFVSAQDDYTLLVRGTERELVPERERQGMGLLPYFPLASGMLTGKYKQNEQLPARTRMAAMKRLAERT